MHCNTEVMSDVSSIASLLNDGQASNQYRKPVHSQAGMGINRTQVSQQSPILLSSPTLLTNTPYHHPIPIPTVPTDCHSFTHPIIPQRIDCALVCHCASKVRCCHELTEAGRRPSRSLHLIETRLTPISTMSICAVPHTALSSYRFSIRFEY